MAGKGPDLIGQRFGRLLVEGVADRRDGVVWACHCDCGGRVDRRTSELRRVAEPTCGCMPGRTTHGASGSKLYACYSNMRSRCENHRVTRYAIYGGRGISVCAEWRARFECFAAWASKSGYELGLSLDRIDNDQGYSPTNCRWVTLVDQSRNRRCTRRLTWMGQSMTPREWSGHLGVSYEAFQLRVSRGWPVDRIFTEPYRHST